MLTEQEKLKFELAEAQLSGKKPQRNYPNLKQRITKETYNKVVSILKGIHFKKGIGRVLTTGFLDAEDCKTAIEFIIKELDLTVKIDGFKDNFYSIKSLEK